MGACIEALITVTKWTPAIFSSLIFAWGWYAYTFQVVLYSMTSLAQQIICWLVFQVLYIFSFWSYVQTIFTPYAKIPSKFFLTPKVSEDLIRAPSDRHREEILAYVVKKNDLPVWCRTYSGGFRYCEKCNLIKPDRCHHCSICGCCVLRMDHHCPWINKCVSFTNHKFFVLFLGYTFALCAFVASTTFPYFLKYWSMPDTSPKIDMNPPINNNQTTVNPLVPETSNQLYNSLSVNNPDPVPFSVKFHILFLFFATSMLAFGVMFLYCYHIHLLLHNRSTLESFRPPLMAYGPDRNAFNLGRRENVRQLFGRSKILWLMPVFTTEGSGLTYDQRPQIGPGDEEVRQELLNNPANKHASSPIRESNTDMLPSNITEI